MPKRILVIDDENGIRDIIQLSLETIAGWQVLLAASGEEGLAIATAAQPDAILLDMIMPTIDGLTTFQRLRENPDTCQIPTILLTAATHPTEERQLLNRGFNGVIAKPFRATELVEQICSLLNW